MNPEHITWLYIPMAILLGALHGLEPGHSKTMMAAFIIAIRGTFTQAIILGVSAALSHSLIIWVLAGGALYFGQQWDAATFEPYMQLLSAAAILTMAFWMFGRTSRDLHDAHHHHHHHHGHGHSHHYHGHHHDHEEGSFLLHIGHQHVELSVFEDGVPPVFRLKAPTGERLPKASEVSLKTTRPDGTKQRFTFTAKEGFLESTEEIPEPHEFEVSLSVAHGDHSHAARCSFKEDAHHDHSHSHDHGHDHDHGHHHHHGGGEAEDFQDAHEREHAEDIQRRFAGRTITTPQIALFGITGGLMPCPAAFSVLLICLQLKKFTLGFAMVSAFSFGLALTMVTTGLLAAWSVHHAEKKFKGFGEIMRKAPYVSCVLLVFVAAYMAWHGWQGLIHAHAH